VTGDSESKVPKTLPEHEFQPLLGEQLVHKKNRIHLPFNTIDQRLKSMPFFAPEDASALTSENLDDTVRIDLSGLSHAEAIAQVEAALLAHATNIDVRLWFYFPPPTPDGGETLFQPVGRVLRAAIAKRQVVRAMPAQGGGWIARLAAKEV
jgi:hypothetical protein